MQRRRPRVWPQWPDFLAGRSGWRTLEGPAWLKRGLRPGRPRQPGWPRSPVPGARISLPGFLPALSRRGLPVPAQRRGRRRAWWESPQWRVPASYFLYRRPVRWVGPDGVRLAWCARVRVARGACYPWLGTWLCLSTPARLAVGFGRGRPAAGCGFTPRACGENKPGELWVPRLCRGSGGSWIAAEPGVNPEAAQRRFGSPYDRTVAGK